jgi:mRNA (guanine-N7-)-methyltransferase
MKRGYDQQGEAPYYKAQKRQYDSTPSSVAQHYNDRPDVGTVKRKESKIIRMRSFNNWVKSVLIQRYVRPNQNVFDMGCGKGGDLNKWAKARIGHLVAAGKIQSKALFYLLLTLYVDIADVSLEQMQNRYKVLRDRTFTAEFYPMDCYQVPKRGCR